MSKVRLKRELLGLPVEDRFEVMSDVWDSLVDEGYDFPLAPGQRKELERRMAKFETGTAKLSTWPDAKRRILKSRR